MHYMCSAKGGGCIGKQPPPFSERLFFPIVKGYFQRDYNGSHTFFNIMFPL